MTIQVPTRFRQELNQHLVLNHLGQKTWPLVLGIFGPPGDGKSFQARHHLDGVGVHVERVNAAELESDRAGQPAKLVLEGYRAAGDRTLDGRPSALMIDDVDTTVGEWENSTGTVNHQQILAQLMHLADSPDGDANGSLRRVPVIMTGNDLTKVYAPLRRSGRMRQFVWTPSPEERLEIVDGILGELLNPQVIQKLVEAFPSAPVAFFSDLVSVMIVARGRGTIDGMAQDLVSVIVDPAEMSANLMEAVDAAPLTDTSVLELAEAEWARREAALSSYLED